MKKLMFIAIFFLLVVFALNHGSTTLGRIEKNVHASYLENCDPRTVKLEKSTLLGLTTVVKVDGWKCYGSEKGGEGYRAEIWDHGFWLL